MTTPVSPLPRALVLSLAPVLTACVLVAAPALAQTPTTGIEDALRIARDNGVASVTKIELDDGKWEVEGRNADQREIEIDIDRTSGKVLKTETR
ncbi:PepSY domain-containing protein [Ancylobacter sp. IITR112]|uniref:PepSY domain-containing protein n=1 Tax=Ancylobacter sp. IITR112 TaxID=3138073 RepID=UPI00352B5B80